MAYQDKNGARKSLPPRIVPFTELGNPPEPAWTLWNPLGFLFVGAIVLLTSLLLVPLSPFIVVLTCIRRFIFRDKNLQYHTPPNKIKVAVIGGGWSGLQCMARLKELGVDIEQNCRGFEQNDGIGGTFHPKNIYESIQIHGSMWVTSFSNFPYNANDRDKNDGKVNAEELRHYIHRFARYEGLEKCYDFNTRVKKVKYDSTTRKAKLVLEECSTRDPTEKESEAFDLVIYASQASEPRIPDIPDKQSYKGTILHSMDFNADKLDDILSNDKSTAIIGGSKTACDLALCLHREKHHKYTWVFRKPYLFWKYEITFHDRSVFNALRGFSTIIAVLWSPLCETLSGLILWGSGLAVTLGQAHNDWKRFHWGILCPKQRKDLGEISNNKKIVGSPKRFLPDGLELEDGSKVRADVVLFGTGCQSGIEKLQFFKDGKAYKLKETTKMFNHFFYPDFPIFANSTALWTTFGPVRGVNSADMAVYHLCIRKHMSENEMIRRATRQFGGATSSVTGMLFQSRTNSMALFVTMHIDLMLAGLVDFFDFFWHAIEMFLLAKQNPLRFRIFPREKGVNKNKKVAAVSQ